MRSLLFIARILIVLGALRKRELDRQAKAEREARFYGRSRWVV